MKHLAIGLVAVLLNGTSAQSSDPANFKVRSAKPMPEWNARFQRNQGWIGGDGAYTVALQPDRTLWLFSDTWVGSIQDGKRTGATIVNNTIALQNGRGESATLDFVIRHDEQKKATAFVAPNDGRGWFWLFGGASVDHRLALFLAQIEKTSDPGIFGFRQVGLSLGIVDNPLDAPLQWRIEQKSVPFTSFGEQRTTTFGAATLIDDGQLYIYGTDEDRSPKNQERYLILARVPKSEVADFTRWRFFADGKWVTDFQQSSRLAKHMASEGSVSYLPGLKQYVLVYTDGGLSDRIMIRTAPKPWGPWSDATQVYVCPEMAADKKLFCYAAKAHPMLADDDELVISYVVNSFDFWQVARDSRLYWPRFVRVKLSPAR